MTFQVGVHVLAAVVHVAGAVGAHEALVAGAVAHHHALGRQSVMHSCYDRTGCTIKKWNTI